LVRATWDFDPPEPEPQGPVYPGNPETGLVSIDWTLLTNNPIQVCFEATVTTTSSENVPWVLTLDLAQPPFNGATTGFGFQQPSSGPNIGSKLRIDYQSAQGTATVRGRSDVWEPVDMISADETLVFRICNYSNIPDPIIVS